MAMAMANRKQDTGKFRTNTKDQFYTHEPIAQQCIQTIQRLIQTSVDYLWVEPSAGNGAFLNNVPAGVPKLGLDIEPQCANILTADFLTWSPPVGQKILLFGNPPFGKQSSLAKSFITKGCQFADVIAFILPKSFTKPSMNNVFAAHFHCMHSEDLPTDSFRINSKPYDVPCVFQIWQRRAEPRPVAEKVQEAGFIYVKPPADYTFALRRVGVYAGKCYVAGGTYSPQSHHFIKLDDQYIPQLQTIMEKINTHTFPSNTVGPRSLSKSEINEVLNELLVELLAVAEQQTASSS
jgi:hypothetical protein